MSVKSWLRNVAIFLAWVMFSNTLLPSLVQASHLTKQGDIFAANQNNGSAEKIIICTSQGIKWVSLSEIPGEGETSPSSKETCPLCYLECPNCFLVSHHVFSVASQLEIPFSITLIVQKAKYRLSLASHHKRDAFLFSGLTRGPPVVANS